MIDRLLTKALYFLGDLAFDTSDQLERLSLYLWAKAAVRRWKRESL